MARKVQQSAVSCSSINVERLGQPLEGPTRCQKVLRAVLYAFFCLGVLYDMYLHNQGLKAFKTLDALSQRPDVEGNVQSAAPRLLNTEYAKKMKFKEVAFRERFLEKLGVKRGDPCWSAVDEAVQCFQTNPDWENFFQELSNAIDSGTYTHNEVIAILSNVKECVESWGAKTPITKIRIGFLPKREIFRDRILQGSGILRNTPADRAIQYLQKFQGGEECVEHLLSLREELGRELGREPPEDLLKGALCEAEQYVRFRERVINELGIEVGSAADRAVQCLQKFQDGYEYLTTLLSEVNSGKCTRAKAIEGLLLKEKEFASKPVASNYDFLDAIDISVKKKADRLVPYIKINDEERFLIEEGIWVNREYFLDEFIKKIEKKDVRGSLSRDREALEQAVRYFQGHFEHATGPHSLEMHFLGALKKREIRSQGGEEPQVIESQAAQQRIATDSTHFLQFLETWVENGELTVEEASQILIKINTGKLLESRGSFQSIKIVKETGVAFFEINGERFNVE